MGPFSIKLNGSICIFGLGKFDPRLVLAKNELPSYSITKEFNNIKALKTLL